MSAPIPTPRKMASRGGEPLELFRRPIGVPRRNSTPSRVERRSLLRKRLAHLAVRRDRVADEARRPRRARRRRLTRVAARASSPAQASPAGPAPITATRRPLRRRSPRIAAPACERAVGRVALQRADRDRPPPGSVRTQAPSHRTSTGQTRAQVPPSRFSAKIVSAAAAGSSAAIAPMKRGTSTPAGQATMQGAGAWGPPHSRQRSASRSASVRVSGGRSSSKTGSSDKRSAHATEASSRAATAVEVDRRVEGERDEAGISAYLAACSAASRSAASTATFATSSIATKPKRPSFRRSTWPVPSTRKSSSVDRFALRDREQRDRVAGGGRRDEKVLGLQRPGMPSLNSGGVAISREGLPGALASVNRPSHH